MRQLKFLFDRLTTKKSIFLIGLSGGIIWALIFGTYNSACSAYYIGLCTYLFDFIREFYLLTNLVFLLPLFFLIGLLRNEVFKPWARFALPWMLVIMFLPNFVSNAPRLLAFSDRGYLDIILMALYILISFFIVLIQSIRIYWLKK